jgi:hypothetical protein
MAGSLASSFLYVIEIAAIHDAVMVAKPGSAMR